MGFVSSIAFAQNEQGKINHNYDLGCSVKKIKTEHGELKNVICFDKQLNKTSKVYLREKLIFESPDLFIKEIKNLFIKDMYVFEYLKKNQNTNSFESYYYLIDLTGKEGKIFKFGVKNSENLDVKADGFCVFRSIRTAISGNPTA
jgi:hypothetical protein